jgi:predicted nucleotidyltransferase
MDKVIIHNRCAHERIDPRFLPLIEAARAGILACCGSPVRELRLQGSIARGDARAGHADLDMIALLEGPCSTSEVHCLERLSASLGAATQLVSRFDLEAIDANTLESFRHFVLSSDSLSIHGTDSLTLPVQTMERLALARLVTPDPAAMVPDYLEWVEELPGADDPERRFASRIIGKDLLKILRGVPLLRGAPYEVVISRVAAQVALFAPEASDVAGQLFALYAEPVTDVAAIRHGATSAALLLEGCPELALLQGVAGKDRFSPGEPST